uniref:Reverse transcriptase zinc-binding domain-containing protein n=1 Tax=Cannabis sativa TaxID=3483 RepID=A0A803PYD6_CANSA
MVGVTKVGHLLLDNGGWNIPLLNSAFDKDTISGLANDKLIWTLEGNGKFSNKLAYLAQALDRAPLCEVAPSLWNRLWWCILAKALPIRFVIGRKFPIEEVSCPLCGIKNETIEHLFLSCNVAFRLWKSFPWGIFLVCDSDIRIWDKVKFIWDLKNKGINSDEVFLYASLTVDTIWRIKIDKVHNNCLFDVTKCIDSIHSSFVVHHAFVLPCSIPCMTDDWRPPPDHLGKVIWAYTSRLLFADALCGKEEACWCALDVAKKLARREKTVRLEVSKPGPSTILVWIRREEENDGKERKPFVVWVGKSVAPPGLVSQWRLLGWEVGGAAWVGKPASCRDRERRKKERMFP